MTMMRGSVGFRKKKKKRGQGITVQSMIREGGVCGGVRSGGDITGRHGQESSVPESSSS